MTCLQSNSFSAQLIGSKFNLDSDLGAQTLLPKLMISPLYTENLDLNAITSGFYFSYVLSLMFLPFLGRKEEKRYSYFHSTLIQFYPK